MKEHDVSLQFGFLRQCAPIQRLSNYYDPWEDAACKLPALVASGSISFVVENLPLLCVDQLRTDGELERAMLVLSMLAHAYIFEPLTCAVAATSVDSSSLSDSNEKRYPRSSLPAPVAVPWTQVAALLSRPPVLSHASIVLYNYSLVDASKPPLVENVLLLNQVCGGIDEHFFFAITVEIEYKGASALLLLASAMQAMLQQDYTMVA